MNSIEVKPVENEKFCPDENNFKLLSERLLFDVSTYLKSRNEYNMICEHYSKGSLSDSHTKNDYVQTTLTFYPERKQVILQCISVGSGNEEFTSNRYLDYHTAIYRYIEDYITVYNKSINSYR